jgi:hypothetical protein
VLKTQKFALPYSKPFETVLLLEMAAIPKLKLGENERVEF